MARDALRRYLLRQGEGGYQADDERARYHEQVQSAPDVLRGRARATATDPRVFDHRVAVAPRTSERGAKGAGHRRLGPTGVGRAMLARVAHYASHRLDGLRMGGEYRGERDDRGGQACRQEIDGVVEPSRGGAECAIARRAVPDHTVEGVDHLVGDDSRQTEQYVPEHRRDDAVGKVFGAALDCAPGDAVLIESFRVAADDARNRSAALCEPALVERAGDRTHVSVKAALGEKTHHQGEAEDPKKVFQAMRPVFNDMVTEVQRSIGFFESLDRNATISHIVGMGNAFKLPGLEPYLEKNLGHKVQVVDSLTHLSGSAVEDAKYKQNVQSLGVCYGLTLQGLNQAKLRTNLVPRELIHARIIREKKPWVLAAASLLMAGLGLSFLLHWHRSTQVAESKYAEQSSQINLVAGTSRGFVASDTANTTKFADLKSIGDQVVGNSDRRFLLLELKKAVNQALPREPGLRPGQVSDLPLEDRVNLYIETVEMQYFGGEQSLADWFDEDVQEAYRSTLVALQQHAKDIVSTQPLMEAMAAGETPAIDTANEDGFAADDGIDDSQDDLVDVGMLEGAGWVIELSGFHYHNKDVRNAGAQYVRSTLMKNLMQGSVELPTSTGPQKFSMEEMGISHVILAFDGRITMTEVRNPNFVPPNPYDFDPQMMGPRMTGRPGIYGAPKTDGASDEPKEEQFISVRENRFKIQFVWQPKRVAERLEARQKATANDTTDDLVGDI